MFEEAYLFSHMRNQLPRISFAPGTRFGSEVDEIVRIGISFPHHLMLSSMKQREELREEPSSSLGGELVVQSPQPTTEEGQPIVHVFPWL